MRLRHISVMGMVLLSVSSTLTQKGTQRGLRLVNMASYTSTTSKDTSVRSPILVQMANPPQPMQAIPSSNVPIIEMEQQTRICFLMRMAIQKHCLKGSTGIKRSGKVNLLLNRNGNIMLCVDNLLNGFPCMVVVFGCVVCLLMIVLPKSLSVVLTIVYVAFILYETLMFRESGNARTNVVLFSYAGKFLKEQSVRVGAINNIWLFIPLGTGLYRWFQKKWVLVIPFVMSVAIETTQYITGLGIAEFDDVFGNTMGGWIGVLVAWTWLNRKMNVKNRA